MFDKIKPRDWITLIVGAVVFAGSWMVAEYRLGEAERRIGAVEGRIDALDEKVTEGRIMAAADHATLKAEVEDMDNEIEGIWPRVDKLAEQLYRLDGKD